MIWEFILAAGIAGDCAAPTWFRSEALKLNAPKDQMLGFGKSADPEQAAREARRELGAQVAKRYGDEILADARVKKGVNFKAYARDEIVAALPPAVAADLTPARLKGDTVCGVRYVAYATTKAKALTNLLRDATQFPQHVNLSLMGRIAEVEKELVSNEPPIPTPKAADVAGAEMTLSRLKKAADGLNMESLVEAQLKEPLLARAGKLKAAIDQVKAIPYEDQRGPALAEAQELARKDEVYLTAVRAYTKEDYLAAFETFQALAREGDATAQFVVGVMYFEGQGQRKNLRESFDWFRRAVAQNHGPAKMMLGLFYVSGYGVKVNHQEAFKWFNSAAQQGWACEAQFNSCKRITPQP
jgi:hypothetical protein